MNINDMDTIKKKIFEYNLDIGERFKKEKVTHHYIKGDDVLLLNLGEPSSSDAINLSDGITTIHYNPATYKITGFTIVSFKAYYAQYNKMLVKKPEQAKPINLDNIFTPIRIALFSLLGLTPTI
jgi:hypothetical protein